VRRWTIKSRGFRVARRAAAPENPRTVGALRPPVPEQLRVQPAGVAAKEQHPPPDDAQSCRSQPHPAGYRSKRLTQTADHDINGRSGAVAGARALHEAGSENCGTSRADKCAGAERDLQNADRWVSVPAPRPRRACRSYLGPSELEIGNLAFGQSNSRAAIIAPESMQWEAFFHRLARTPRPGTFAPSENSAVLGQGTGKPYQMRTEEEAQPRRRRDRRRDYQTVTSGRMSIRRIWAATPKSDPCSSTRTIVA
jgi:hypothetical protein